MTPDRPDQTPPDDDENDTGVLPETGGIDATSLGIIGGVTAQVSVVLPGGSDEDDIADDDVVGDEIAYEDMPGAVAEDRPDGEDRGESADGAAHEPEPHALEVQDGAVAEPPADGAEGTAAEDAVTASLPDGADPDGQADDAPAPADRVDVAVADVHAEQSADSAGSDSGFRWSAVPAGWSLDDVEAASAAPEVAADTAAAEIVEEIDDQAAADAEGYADEDITDAVVVEVDAAPAWADEADAAASEPPSGSEAAFAAAAPGEAAAPEEPSTTSVAQTAVPAPADVQESPVTPDNDSPAVLRPATAVPRSAAPEGEAARAPREVARTVRPEVALTSKRLDDFEADRETADLLTADRLLDPTHVVASEPEGAWQHFVYRISGHRINLGDGRRARERKALDGRIAAPLSGGARFVPVLSRKGGVGKTTVTTLLGMALADARDDRIIAVDANPDRGTLADRIARSSGRTVRDLVRVSGDVVGYNDLSTIVARDETRLDVVASDADPRVSEAFSDTDYDDVARLAAHYYSVVLTDTGTGIVHSVMGATLARADQLVIVAGLTVDEARLASETLTWLETNGYADQARKAVVVLNNARPGAPVVRADELEQHFRTRVRAVVRLPYDPQIAAGSAIQFRDLQPATRVAARELAAAVVEGLRRAAV